MATDQPDFEICVVINLFVMRFYQRRCMSEGAVGSGICVDLVAQKRWRRY